MGRPSIQYSRTTRAGASHADDETSLSSAVTFKRRFPRIGTTFQSKLPKALPTSEGGEPYTTNRPIPDQMSTEIPTLTENEVKLLKEGKSTAGKFFICAVSYRADGIRL